MRQENPGGGGEILFLGGIAALGYYLYTQGFFNSFFGSGAAPAVGTNLATGQPAATGGATAPTGGGSSPGAATYSGPSLDQMFSSLLAAEQAAMMASSPDPALSCNGDTTMGVTTSPVNVVLPPITGGGTIATNPNQARTAAGQVLATQPTFTTSALSGLGATACSMPMATYDVHNWYLVNRANAGITTAPNPPDHTTVLSVQDYWTWAAPQLKAMIPGLSGGFGTGLGMFAEVGQLLRMQRGY